MSHRIPDFLRRWATAVLVGSVAQVAFTSPAEAQAGGAGGGRPPYTAADVHFMSGMIVHHAQAVLMAGWAGSHGASQAMRTMCERISVSQQDEIAFMRRWLAARGESVPPADPRGLAMPEMGHHVLMPGMLTAAQLAQLDSARGPEFDRLFLTLMIQHHRGAIVMVDELFASPGAAQDGEVYRFAADVHTDQTAEIERMTRMLLLSASPRRGP